MTDDEFRWAEALAIERWKGLGAAAFIAERIETLGQAGDAAGAERFEQLKRRFDQLQPAARQS